MSEHTELYSGALHALWLNYKPSEGLENHVGQLLKPGIRAGFLFRSTSEVLVDSFSYYHDSFRDESARVEKKIEAERRQAFQISRVAMKLIEFTGVSEGAVRKRRILRVAALPTDIDATRFSNLSGVLEEFPNVEDSNNKMPSAPYMVVDFPGSRIKDGLSETDIETFNKGVSEKVGKGLFTASVIGLGGAETGRTRDDLEAGRRDAPMSA